MNLLKKYTVFQKYFREIIQILRIQLLPCLLIVSQPRWSPHSIAISTCATGSVCANLNRKFLFFRSTAVPIFLSPISGLFKLRANLANTSPCSLLIYSFPARLTRVPTVCERNSTKTFCASSSGYSYLRSSGWWLFAHLKCERAQ